MRQLKFQARWLVLMLAGITVLYLAWNVYLFANTHTKTVPDTAQYKYVATLSITSTDFWLDWRPTTSPLLFKILGNNDSAIVHTQFIIGLLSWLTLAVGVVVNTRHDILKIMGFASVLFVGTGTDFSLVYRALSTEGVAYSLTALLIGVWLLAIAYVRAHPTLSRRGQIGVAIALLCATFIWSVSRYPHAFILLGSTAILMGLLVMRWRQLQQWRVIFAILIIGAFATFLFQSQPVSQSEYWKQGFMNALAEKVLPDKDDVEFFAERGMPADEEALKYAGYVPARYAGDWEPVFDEWLDSDARLSYFVDYLVLNPVPRLVEIAENWENIFSPNMAVWYHSRQTANGDLNTWREDVRYLYYDPSAFTFLVGGLVSLFLLGMVIFQQRKLPARLLLPLVVLTLALPAAYMNWYGDAYYERVFIGVSLQTKVAVLLIALFSIDSLREYKQSSRMPHLIQRSLIAFLILIGMMEATFGFAAIRNNIAYPVLSSIAPNTNIFRFWDVSDLEYHIYQEAPIGDPVMSLQQSIIDGAVYYREYIMHWSEAGIHGELRDDNPDDPIELAWRNTPVSYAEASPDGRVYGGYPFDAERGAAFAGWQATRLPANLKAAGIHYLHVDTAVWDTLPAYQVGGVQNPEFYQRVASWETQGTPQHLYRIIGDISTWTLPPTLADAPLGLDDQHAAAYQNYLETFELVAEDAVIFNPASGEAFSRQIEINTLGSIIAYTNPADEALNSLFDLLAVFERMSFEGDLNADQRSALATWRDGKNPATLNTAGVDYIFFEATWASWLPEAELATLSNPANYELVAEWRGNTPNRYVLMQVLGD